MCITELSQFNGIYRLEATHRRRTILMHSNGCPIVSVARVVAFHTSCIVTIICSSS